MKTWLSGALINQDTCKEGLDGTNGIVKALVAGSLDQVTSLLYDILSNVKPTPTAAPPKAGSSPAGGKKIGGGGGGGGRSGGRKLIPTNDGFPDWVKSHDRNLLQAANGAMADVVVAADGTGNFSTIKDAINAAPELSSKRFVIYVKKGVYKEYVEIGKKKWNVMMIGDGFDVTVISGNRNYIDGWTTYRSATFGKIVFFFFIFFSNNIYIMFIHLIKTESWVGKITHICMLVCADQIIFNRYTLISVVYLVSFDQFLSLLKWGPFAYELVLRFIFDIY